jgi:hypothetical protein
VLLAGPGTARLTDADGVELARVDEPDVREYLDDLPDDIRAQIMAVGLDRAVLSIGRDMVDVTLTDRNGVELSCWLAPFTRGR